MDNLIIWSKNKLLKATRINKLPKSFLFEGHKFEPLNFYYADVDYLRNGKKQLIGFGYAIGNAEDEMEFQKQILHESSNIKIQGGTLLLLLKNDEFEYDVVQAIGTEIYHDNAGHFIFAIPDWGFGELGFDLASIEESPHPD